MINRVKNLDIILPNILQQCDVLHVNLIGYSSKYTLPSILINDKIKISKFEKVGSEFRFFHYNNYIDSYYFTIDDDILYPIDYSDKMIFGMKSHNNNSIYCVHGTTPDVKKLYNVWANRPSYPFQSKLNYDSRVLAPGVGTSCFYTSTLKIDMDWFEYPNISDAYLCCFAYNQNVPIYSIKRENRWLRQLEEFGTHIWGTHPHNIIDNIIHKSFDKK
jgi:hypothetical protein